MRQLASGVVLITAIAVGLHLLPDAGNNSATAAATPTPTTTPHGNSSPATSLAAAPHSSTAADPAPPKPSRTKRQQAAGLRADGTVIPVPAHGSGRFRPSRQSRRTSADRGPLIRFDVAVERDLAIDPDQAALLIAQVLDDHRSWRGLGTGRFTLVDTAKAADVHAYLATPDTTDRLCAPYQTLGKVSCQNGDRVVLNARRWVDGAKAYGNDTTSYRRYLINHEFGHALGLPHASCPGAGRAAPVMMQQTKGLKACRPNTWPSTTQG